MIFIVIGNGNRSPARIPTLYFRTGGVALLTVNLDHVPPRGYITLDSAIFTILVFKAKLMFWKIGLPCFNSVKVMQLQLMQLVLTPGGAMHSPFMAGLAGV